MGSASVHTGLRLSMLVLSTLGSGSQRMQKRVGGAFEGSNPKMSLIWRHRKLSALLSHEPRKLGGIWGLLSV